MPATFVYAVEIIIVKRERFSFDSQGPNGLQFSTTRIAKQGMLDEFFANEADAHSFKREWIECHRGEARVATFRVQGSGFPVAQTDVSINQGREWMADLNGYTPDLRSYTENMKAAN